MSQLNQNLAINAAPFDNDESTDDNCVRLDNRTAYGLNIVHDLLIRGNTDAAKRALTELRYNGRLFNSQKYFVGVPALLVARKDD